MAVLGMVAIVILMCIGAAIWATGSTTTRQFNFRGRGKAVDHHEPRPRAPGLN